MPTVAELNARLTADASNFKRGMAEAQSSLTQVGQQTRTFGDRMNQLGTRMASMGRTMTMGVTLPIVGGFALAIREAQEAAKATAQTEAVIKSTGGAANVTAKEVSNLADQMSKKTAIDDEVIQTSANMMLTFTKVRNEVGKGNDIFNQATEAAIDMSVAMGTDAQSAALQLGKALNDPISGLTALRRVGVAFTQQQKEQIAAAVFFGDTMTAQKIILKEVMTEFGGSAEAAKTPLDELKVKFQQLAEEIGTKAMPVLTRFGDVIISLIEGFLRMPDWAQTFVIGAAAITAAVGPIMRFAGAVTQLATSGANGLGFFGKLGMAAGALAFAFGAAEIAGNALGRGTFRTIGEEAETMRAKMDSLTEAVRQQGTVLGETTRKWVEQNAFSGDAGRVLLDVMARAGIGVAELELQLSKGAGSADVFLRKLREQGALAGLTGEQVQQLAARVVFLGGGYTGAVAQANNMNKVMGEQAVRAGIASMAVLDTTGKVTGYRFALGTIPAATFTALTADASQGIAAVESFKASLAGIGPAAAAAAAAATSALAGVGAGIGAAASLGALHQP